MPNETSLANTVTALRSTSTDDTVADCTIRWAVLKLIPDALTAALIDCHKSFAGAQTDPARGSGDGPVGGAYALSRDSTSRLSSITCFSRSITALEHMAVSPMSFTTTAHIRLWPVKDSSNSANRSRS
ncbi:MAG: hypothetical protein QOH91_4088, partial [Mycobacterium sp.]|nr:hypothetical protein [Mycobacterium sp.]